MMVFAMFAATLSSLDTALNGNAAIMVRNVLPMCFRKLGRDLPEESRLLVWSRYFTLGFGAMVVGAAMLIGMQDEVGIFDIAIAITAYLVTPMAIPLILGLFFRRAPGWSCLAAAAAALLPSLGQLVWPELFTFNERVFLTAAIGSIVFVASTRFPETGAKQQRIDEFFRNMRRPVDFGREVGQANNAEQLRLIGVFASAVGVFLLALLLLPNPFGGRMAILGSAVTVLLVGALFLWRAKSSREAVRRTGAVAARG
jgi:hypothetical protein